MGWFLDGSEHEGYVAEVNHADRLGERADPKTGLIHFDDGTTSTEDEIVGWQLVCSCEWRSMFWPKTNTHYDNEHLDREVQGHAFWLEHIAGTGVRDDLIEIMRQAERVRQARWALDQAVATARKSGATWEDVGRSADMSRQSAHERWS